MMTKNSFNPFNRFNSLPVLCCLLLSAGCSKGKKEPKITGRHSDPPISLHCAWKAGYRYHLRLEVDTLTDNTATDPQETEAHRVTFAQECMVTATNSGRGDRVGLDMEILSLAMERAKGTQVAMSFDSEQGGETADELGYIPALQNMVGGHLHFLISPDGKMLRADGLPEWLARALGESPGRPPPLRTVTKTLITTNAPPADSGPVPTNAPPNVVRKVGRNIGAPPPGSTPGSRRNAVSSTLRNFFTPDLYRQMLEFRFLPSALVRVGDEWKTQGDLPLNGRVQFRFDASGKFPGWQQHGQTNCARVDVHGTLSPQGTPPPAGPPAKKSSPSPVKDTLQATLWVDTQLSFPVTTVWDTHAALSSPNTIRQQGTNNFVTNSLPKSVHQNVAITLLDASSIEIPAVEAAPSSK